MMPFIRDGDILDVTRAGIGDVRVGDVVCYEMPPGRLFFHRVIQRAGDGFVAKGDALAFSENVDRAQLLGKVIGVDRHGRCWRFDTPAARWRNRAIALVSPFLPRLLFLAVRLKHAWRAAARG